MSRIYLTQGDLDGACFLYSIANSVAALSAKKPTVKQWSKALEYIPSASDFLDGSIGTKNYDDRHEIYKFAIEQALSEYSPSHNYNVLSHPDIDNISQISKLIGHDSVAILNINGEHWICVVDIEKSKNKLFAACSDVTDTQIFYYKELKCDRFDRFFNKEYQLNAKCSIYKPSVIQIQKSR